MKKRIRGKIAGVLTAVLLGMAIFPNTAWATGDIPGEPVAASGNEDENVPADTQGANEGITPADPAGEPAVQDPVMQEPQNPESEAGIDAQSAEGETSGEASVAAPGLINYIGIDLPYLQAPAEQKIAVSYGDGTENVSAAKIICAKPDGSEMELSLTERENGLYLFRRIFEESEAGVYKLLRFVYVQDGVENTIVLQDIGVDAMFGVNEYYPGYESSDAVDIAKEAGVEEPAEEAGQAALAEAGVTPEEVEVSVVSVDMNDVGSAETDVKEAIEGTAEDVDAGQTVSKSSDGASAVDTVLSSVADILMPAATAKAAGNKVVVLDPGHGGSDAGATANGLYEKNITLRIAQYCKEELEQYSGVDVYMTRTSDIDVGLTERVVKAKNWGADVFVSIHINSADAASAKGVEVWYPNANYNPQVQQKGKDLAADILNELKALGLYNRGIKENGIHPSAKYPDGSGADYYSVIRDSKSNGFPGIIVEHAFISNVEDAAKLKQDSFLKQLGVADATGIANYFDLSKGLSVRVTDKNDFTGTATIKASCLGANAKIRITNSSTGKSKNYPLSSGNGTVNFKISDFGGALGNYSVEGISSNNKVLHSTSFSMSSAKCSISVSSDGQEKQYQINVNFESAPSGMAAVQVPVWSDEGGQDDLVWYTAKEVSKGKWQATVNISNHRSTGNYTAHVYALMTDGRTQKLLGSTAFTVSSPTTTSKITATTGNYNADAGTFDVVVKNVTSPSGVSAVYVPVWCASDQSDIYWYEAKKQSNGTYKATVNAANHNYAAGLYKVHVYVMSGNGIMSFGAEAPGVVVKESSQKATVTAKDTDGRETKYLLTATKATAFGTPKEVHFATWSDEGGQDDIVWYPGTRSSAGTYTANADIRNHKSAGRYNVHVYVRLANGQQRFLGATAFTVSKPTLSVTTGAYDKGKGTFDVTVTNVKSASGVSKIQVPVWCAGDQSDIKWYEATKQNNGTYKATVRMSNHGFSVGIYKVHTYITAGNGLMSFAGAAAGVNMTLPEVSISAADADGKGTNFALKASNTNVFGAIRNVQFATWSAENGQDDIRWYGGTRNTSGDWTALVNVKNHGSSGLYHVHVYATLADGRLSFMGATTFEVSKATVTGIKVQGYDQSSGAFQVVVSGAKAPSGVSKVQIPVWCAANQNDIKWYDAVKQSNGTYVANVSPTNHKSNSGLYKIHVYVLAGNGTLTFVGNTSQMVDAAKYPIMGSTTVSRNQMVAYYNKYSPVKYPSVELGLGGAGTLEKFCQIYLEEAAAEGVRAEVAFAQAMKETGFLRYGGIVKINQFNFAGIGALDGNATGNCATFVDVREGVRAQIQHLKAYASKDTLRYACVDPRFNKVARGCAPYVEWLGQKENPQGYGWATDPTYGRDLASQIKTLNAM